MKQLVVTYKVLYDFIDQDPVLIYKTYCSKCSFCCDTTNGEKLSFNGLTCRMPLEYSSLCKVGTKGFYQKQNDDNKASMDIYE
jgi:hypothetical protein